MLNFAFAWEKNHIILCYRSTKLLKNPRGLVTTHYYSAGTCALLMPKDAVKGLFAASFWQFSLWEWMTKSFFRRHFVRENLEREIRAKKRERFYRCAERENKCLLNKIFFIHFLNENFQEWYQTGSNAPKTA